MRDFSKVSPSVWGSERFNNLRPLEKLVYLYLLTNPHSNSVGCYLLRLGYASEDLKMEKSDILNCINTVSRSGMIGYNAKENTIRIDNWFTFNPPMNAKHAKKMAGELVKLPHTALKIIAIKEFQDVCKAHNWKDKDKVHIPLLHPDYTVSIPYTHRDLDEDRDSDVDKKESCPIPDNSNNNTARVEKIEPTPETPVVLNYGLDQGQGADALGTSPDEDDAAFIAACTAPQPIENKKLVIDPKLGTGEYGEINNINQVDDIPVVNPPARQSVQIDPNDTPDFDVPRETGTTGRERYLWQEFPCVTAEEFANRIPPRYQAVLVKFINEPEFRKAFALDFWERYVGAYPGDKNLAERFPLKENWFLVWELQAENYARRQQGLPQRKVFGSKATEALRNKNGLS